MFGMGTGGSSLPSSPLLLYISVFPHSYIYLFISQKTNNYIANLYERKEIFISAFFVLLKSVKIIDFFLFSEESYKSFAFQSFLIEIKPNDLLVSVS